jgi:hypothetical protein
VLTPGCRRHVNSRAVDKDDHTWAEISSAITVPGINWDGVAGNHAAEARALCTGTVRETFTKGRKVPSVGQGPLR